MHALKFAVMALAVTLGVAAHAATLPAQRASNPASAPLQNAPLHTLGIDHVGMNVPDIDAAIRFFTELTGAKVISDTRPGAIPAQWKQQFRWHASSELQRFVMLQLAGGAKIELFHYEGADVDPQFPHGDDAGASHVALMTADIDQSLAAIKARGLKVLNEPITNPDGVRWFYFLTPWGAQVELVSQTRV
ncbi:VOC family protein [Pseudomonas sp. NPDC090202]|uniref:VOC family protein n=1 Tax=unclassified Pseudomonas TaxID=196821 RepID=UPI003800A0F2